MGVFTGVESQTEFCVLMNISVKAFLPKPFKPEVYLQEIESMMRRMGKDIKGNFEQTTETWNKKPDFENETVAETDKITTTVATENEIYGFVNDGTEEHLILPGILTGKSNKKALAFSSASSPKTTPGVIGSNPGVIGKRDTVRQFVNHPGGKPRNFTGALKKRWQPRFKRRADITMRIANKKAGHAAG